jgi:RNA polymerase sigma-70 factor, ECF subfamily
VGTEIAALSQAFPSAAPPIRSSTSVVGLSDTALMVRFKAGESRAFDELYQRHRGSLYRYYLRQAPRSSVDDLFQETWLRLIKGSSSYEPSAPFGAYLFRIAHNVLVDHYRRSGRSPEFAGDEEIEAIDQTPQPADLYGQAALRESFLAALESLPAAQREAFLLQQEGGLTLEEIAQIAGSNRETIKSRLRYAVARLRRILAAEFAGEYEQA